MGCWVSRQLAVIIYEKRNAGGIASRTKRLGIIVPEILAVHLNVWAMNRGGCEYGVEERNLKDVFGGLLRCTRGSLTRVRTSNPEIFINCLPHMLSSLSLSQKTQQNLKLW